MGVSFAGVSFAEVKGELKGSSSADKLRSIGKTAERKDDRDKSLKKLYENKKY